mgnify:CR=1 FL=1
MTMREYEMFVAMTAIYPKAGRFFGGRRVPIYPVLGLCGEAGEVAEKVKKIIRDGAGIIRDDDRRAIVLELGDALWYLTRIAADLDVSLEEVAEANIEKLRIRDEKGTLRGSGDER